MFKAADNTSCPIGCPVDGRTPGSPAAGFTLDTFLFTASTGEDCATTPAGGCGEAIVISENKAGSTITYDLIEPDIFWSATGTDTFAAGDGVGVGASWTFVGGGTSELPGGDPPCTSCSVTTSTVSTAPEPGSWLLLAGGLGAAIFKVRGRLR